jgi:hypothetical protein
MRYSDPAAVEARVAGIARDWGGYD